MPELKRVNPVLVEELAQVVNQWIIDNVYSGSGTVVITIEKTEGGVSKTVASAAIVEDSMVEWVSGGQYPVFLSTWLQAEGLTLPTIIEDKPEPVILANMWRVFETRNYITQQVREDIETAVATHIKMPNELRVVLPSLNCVIGFPEDYPRSFLENVFLAHVYDHLLGVVQAGKAPSFLKTKGVNRPEITGLSRVPRVVCAGDGETVQDVLKGVALELVARGVKIGDSYQQSKLEHYALEATNRYWENER